MLRATQNYPNKTEWASEKMGYKNIFARTRIG